MEAEIAIGLLTLAGTTVAALVWFLKELFKQHSQNTMAFTDTLKLKTKADGLLAKSIDNLSNTMNNNESRENERHNATMEQFELLHKNIEIIQGQADRNYEAINVKVHTQHVKNQIVETETIKNKGSK